MPAGDRFLAVGVYRSALVGLFLLSMVSLRTREHLRKYCGVVFVFFMASVVSILQLAVEYASDHLGWSTSTIEGFVYFQLLSTAAVVGPIVVLTKLSGRNLSSLYLRRGNLRLGILVGSAALLVFLATAPQLATLLFRGQNISLERFISWVPWLLAFVLSNGLREELWTRGLFLKEFQFALGPRMAIFLQALIFTLWHIDVRYTPFLFFFLVLTFFLAYALGVLIVKTDSLLGSALVHAGADLPIILGSFSTF